MLKTTNRKNKKTIIFYLLLGTIAMTYFSFNRIPTNNMTGVYWGAFNPPTEAHAAIIVASLKNIRLKKLIIVVNNHSYKNYVYPNRSSTTIDEGDYTINRSKKCGITLAR